MIDPITFGWFTAMMDAICFVLFAWVGIEVGLRWIVKTRLSASLALLSICAGLTVAGFGLRYSPSKDEEMKVMKWWLSVPASSCTFIGLGWGLLYAPRERRKEVSVQAKPRIGLKRRWRRLSGQGRQTVGMAVTIPLAIAVAARYGPGTWGEITLALVVGTVGYLVVNRLLDNHTVASAVARMFFIAGTMVLLACISTTGITSGADIWVLKLGDLAALGSSYCAMAMLTSRRHALSLKQEEQ